MKKWIWSLFPATSVPRFPAIGDEIGECSRFPNQSLRRETKRGLLQSRTTRGDCFFERLPIRGFGQRTIGACRQEHCEIVVIAESLTQVTQSLGQCYDRWWPTAAEQA